MQSENFDVSFDVAEVYEEMTYQPKGKVWFIWVGELKAKEWNDNFFLIVGRH